jgi:hypothetical protein
MAQSVANSRYNRNPAGRVNSSRWIMIKLPGSSATYRAI